jgi:signal transduction histidine kinase
VLAYQAPSQFGLPSWVSKLVLYGAVGLSAAVTLLVARDQRRALAEKEALLARVVEVAEHERMRLAVDLHDGPIQQLTAVTLRIDLLAAHVERGNLADAQASAQRIRADLSAEMGSLRQLMSNLHPPVLDERGIGSALLDCARQVLKTTGITARVESAVDERLAPELEAALYRITREALVNVRKHSDAQAVVVGLARDGDLLALSVADDGSGFDSIRLNDSRDGHLGLTAIRELAESVGGRAKVRSTPGSGACVDVLVPYRPARAAAGRPIEVAA